eukprot:6197799-Pleurochrysis_carterae.AAC.4
MHHKRASTPFPPQKVSPPQNTTATRTTAPQQTHTHTQRRAPNANRRRTPSSKDAHAPTHPPVETPSPSRSALGGGATCAVPSVFLSCACGASPSDCSVDLASADADSTLSRRAEIRSARATRRNGNQERSKGRQGRPRPDGRQ